MIEITNEKIDEQAVLDSVKDQDSGACVLFVGTTRRMTGAKETVTLKYEAYREMAIEQMTSLSEKAAAKWPLKHCSIVHRLGQVDIGETSIAVAVGSPHRVDAFEAASWLMDELKAIVPIWKQEHWTDGSSEWVHPTETDGSKAETSESKS